MASLYLTESKTVTVRTEGKSLRIETQGRPPSYVPARRVDRAVIWGGVLVDTSALGLLLAGGAPISFAARDGRLLGTAWPAGTDTSSLAGLVERRRIDPSWVEAYRLQLESQVRVARLALLRGRDAALWTLWRDRGFRARDWESWRRTAFENTDAAGHAAWRYLKTLVLGAVSGWLLRDGLDPDRGVLDPKPRLGLVREFSQPLVPWIDGAVLWGERSGVLDRSTRAVEGGEPELTPAGVRRWTARFEAELPWLERDTQKRIDALAALARDWQPTPFRPRRSTR